jgi:hypothetical protein
MTKSNVAQLPQRQEQEIKNEVGGLLDAAKAMVITNPQEASLVVNFGRDVNASIKKIREFFKPMKDSARAAHKAICDRENETLAIPEEAKRIASQKLTTYNQEQERIRLAEEARLREEARKQHERDLAKAQAKIDKILSKTNDNQETIELLNMELKRDDLTDTEIQKIEAQIEIEQAIIENNQERAEEIQARADEPVYVAPTIMPKTEKVAGMVTKHKVEMQILNPLAVIKSIADGLLPTSCVKINEAEIKKHILAFKEQRKAYPGISYQIIKDTHVR